MADEPQPTPLAQPDEIQEAGNLTALPPVETFVNTEALAQYDEYVAYLREFVMMEDAYEQLRAFKLLLKGFPDLLMKYPEAYQKITNMMWTCRAICLPLLELDEVTELFNAHLGLVVDIHGKESMDAVKAFVQKEYSYKRRDEIKQRLLDTLIRSQERITTQGPLLSGREATPSVENWIKDYISNVGTGYADAFKRSAYLTKGPSIVRLPENEKIRVRMILMLRDKLPLSSTTLEGLEETVSAIKDGKPVTLKEGKLEEIPPGQYAEYKRLTELAMKAIEDEFKEKREAAMKELGVTSPADMMIEHYRKWTEEPLIQAALQQLEGYMKGAALHAVSEYEEIFFTGINRKGVSQVIAALWAMGREKALKTSIGDSPRYQRYWEHQLEKSQILNAKSQIEEFKKDPAAARHVLAFLKHILIERLKLPEESVKLVVLTLSNECRKAGEEEYAHLAYGDLETGEFKWNA